MAIELNSDFPEIDLSVSGPAATVEVRPGDTASMRFVVANDSGPVADDVWVYFMLPGVLELVSVEPDDPATMRCDTRGQDVACELGGLAFPDSAGINLDVRLAQPLDTGFVVQARSAWADDPNYVNNVADVVLVAKEDPPPRRKSGSGSLDIWMLMILASATVLVGARSRH